MRAGACVSLIALCAVAACGHGGDARGRVQPFQSFKPDVLSLPSGCARVPDDWASDHHAIKFWSAGAVTGPMELVAPVRGLTVRARGDQCQGAPKLVVRIDGAEAISSDVSKQVWTDYRGVIALDRGRHQFEISFPNDLWIPPDCDRNLYIDKVSFLPLRSPGDGGIAGDALDLPPGAVVVADPLAASGMAVELASAGTATGEVYLPAPVERLTVRARGDQCHGPPTLLVSVDRIQRLSADVTASLWADYSASVRIGKGPHEVEVTFPNDVYLPPACDRNLYVDRLSFLPTGSGSGDPE